MGELAKLLVSLASI